MSGVTITSASHVAIARLEEQATRCRVTVSGVVIEAHAVRETAILQLDGGGEAKITVPAAHLNEITDALHRRNIIKVRVRGDGELDLKTGRVKRVDVGEMVVIKAPSQQRPIYDSIYFEELARTEPEKLLSLLDGRRLRPTELTFAAEVAGSRLHGNQLVTKRLLQLTKHAESYVREGAIYGLAEHSGKNVDEALKRLAEKDESPGVRAAAAGVLGGRA